ncbi:MAG TPA: ATP-binding protein [Candidatus Saccharimonadia bacterium]
MKLQARFLILFLVLFGVIGLLLVTQRIFDLDRSKVLLENELVQHKAYFGKITSLDGQPLKSFSIDYSFWDDMVDFVQTKNPKFAHDNIDSALSTYGADMAWVYRADGTLVYFKSGDDNPALSSLGLSADYFKTLYTNHLDHFYLNTSQGLIEVRAATIHPGSDQKRNTPPQGFWVVARRLDDQYASTMSDLTQSKVKLGGPRADYADHLANNAITFGQPLKDNAGKVVAVITATAEVPIVANLSDLYSRQLYLLIAFAIATMLMLVGAVWYMVLSPMRVIAQSLAQSNPAMLDGLAAQKTEFGALALTVQQFFAQEIKIKETDFIKAKLVELNQAKSEFLAIAAHELKGSVGNVHVFSENLADLIGDAHTTREALLTEVKRISHQARKATVLINDMYQASKGGQSLVLNKTEFDFDEFMRDEVADAQYSTKQQIVLTGYSAAHVTSDRDRLSQVISNLLRNASKYSPAAKEIRVLLGRDGNQVVVQVQDYGIGIAEVDQPHIFERFFRSSGVLGNYPGLGLGLSICKEIMGALGGKVWFKSVHGQGSQFFVSLPVSSASVELS